MNRESTVRGLGWSGMLGDGDISVRRADRDLALRVGVVALCHADAPQWPLAAWEALSEGRDERCLLVAVDARDAVTGWIGGSCHVGTAEIETVLVLPAMRRRGLARHLLEAWLAWARACGATECLLEVRASNEAALVLYRRAGFAVQGRRRRYYSAPEEDALLLRVPLASREAEAPGESCGT